MTLTVVSECMYGQDYWTTTCLAGREALKVA